VELSTLFGLVVGMHRFSLVVQFRKSVRELTFVTVPTVCAIGLDPVLAHLRLELSLVDLLGEGGLR
jgi:hypothetical protein